MICIQVVDRGDADMEGYGASTFRAT